MARCARRILASLATAIGVVALAASPASADLLQKIKQRGTLIVGVKSDLKPWAFLDTSGKAVGMEVDLARDIADRIGVKLETVVVQSANRLQFLQQGRVDILLASVGDLPERRKVAGMIHPYYNSSGQSILTPKKYAFKQWTDLKGKQVCGTQGSYYNKMQSEAYGLQIVAFKTIEEALAALRAGNCVAFLQNDTLIAVALMTPEWKDYEMPLKSDDGVGWSIVVPLAEGQGALAKMLSEAVTDWHRTGKLMELNTKWGLPNNQWYRDMAEKHKK